MSKFIRDNRGQAVVELALVIPILILLLMGIMEFGRIFAGYLELQNVARDGARYASVGKEDGEIETIIKDRMIFLDPDSPLFTKLEITPSERVAEDPVKVRLEYDLNIITPLIRNIIGNEFTLKAEVIMRVE